MDVSFEEKKWGLKMLIARGMMKDPSLVFFMDTLYL